MLGSESGLFDLKVLDHFMQPLADSECMISMEVISKANEPISHFREKASGAQKRVVVVVVVVMGVPKAIVSESKGKLEPSSQDLCSDFQLGH